jgi:hypothetical protein
MSTYIYKDVPDVPDVSADDATASLCFAPPVKYICVYMYVCICMCVYVCVYMYVCICMNIQTYKYVPAAASDLNKSAFNFL